MRALCSAQPSPRTGHQHHHRVRQYRLSIEFVHRRRCTAYADSRIGRPATPSSQKIRYKVGDKVCTGDGTEYAIQTRIATPPAV
jgi:hypothetical protein